MSIVITNLKSKLIESNIISIYPLMYKLLITGGCGFIGSHTCLEFLNKGYELYVLDSNINSFPDIIDRVKTISNNNNLHFYKGDIRDRNILNKIFFDSKKTGLGIVGVIHFAGLKAVNKSIVNPLDYWDSNVNGTINLLNVMEKNNCNTIIFSSSATIYGLSSKESIMENSLIKPTNPYGNTKATIEKILCDLYKSKDNQWKIISLRYFNPIGAHKSGLIGEKPKDIPENILPLLNKVAAGQIKEFKVFGKDWATKDGTCVRDYIHVMDLALAHFKAFEYIFNEQSNNIQINIGTGKGTSIIELINTYKEVNGVDIPYIFVKRRDGDVPYSVADNKLAKNLLNWIPKRDLKLMCRDSWNWFIRDSNHS